MLRSSSLSKQAQLTSAWLSLPIIHHSHPLLRSVFFPELANDLLARHRVWSKKKYVMKRGFESVPKRSVSKALKRFLYTKLTMAGLFSRQCVWCKPRVTRRRKKKVWSNFEFSSGLPPEVLGTILRVLMAFFDKSRVFTCVDWEQKIQVFRDLSDKKKKRLNYGAQVNSPCV